MKKAWEFLAGVVVSVLAFIVMGSLLLLPPLTVLLVLRVLFR